MSQVWSEWPGAVCSAQANELILGCKISCLKVDLNVAVDIRCHLCSLRPKMIGFANEDVNSWAIRFELLKEILGVRGILKTSILNHEDPNAVARWLQFDPGIMSCR